MGWASGSRVLSEIIEAVMENVSDNGEREELYNSLIDIFEDADCDTIEECLEIDEVFDDVYYEKYPEDTDIEEDLDDWDDQSGGSF